MQITTDYFKYPKKTTLHQKFDSDVLISQPNNRSMSDNTIHSPNQQAEQSDLLLNHIVDDLDEEDLIEREIIRNELTKKLT